MNLFKQLICPVSPERVDENRVRVTALGVILIMGVFFVTGNVAVPGHAGSGLFYEGLYQVTFSPLSWLAHKFVMATGTKPVLIDKAPKVFAARIGLLFTISITAASIFGFPTSGQCSGSCPGAFCLSGVRTQLLHGLLVVYLHCLSVGQKNAIEFGLPLYFTEIISRKL